LTEPTNPGEFGAGLSVGGRFWYDQPANTLRFHNAGGAPQSTLALNGVLTTTSQDLIGAINEVAAASGLPPSFLNIGGTTDAAAPGDFATGLVGAARMAFNQVLSLLRLYDAGGIERARLDGLTGEILSTLTSGTSFRWNPATSQIELDDGVTTNLRLDASGYSRFGTLTDPLANGDIGAGLAGAGRWWYDQSTQVWEFYDNGGALKYTLDNNATLATTATEIVAAINEVLSTIPGSSLLNVGTTTDSVAPGDISAGLAGAAARWSYDQSTALFTFRDATGAVKYTLNNSQPLATSAQEIIAAINEVNAAVGGGVSVIDRSATIAGPFAANSVWYTLAIPGNTLSVDGMSVEVELDFDGTVGVGANLPVQFGLAGQWTPTMDLVSVPGGNTTLKVYARITRVTLFTFFVSLMCAHEEPGIGGGQAGRAHTMLQSATLPVPGGDWTGLQTATLNTLADGATWTMTRRHQLAQVLA